MTPRRPASTRARLVGARATDSRPDPDTAQRADHAAEAEGRRRRRHRLVLDAQLAISASSAIGAYIVGVLIGSRVAGVPDASDPVWPRQVTWALSVELIAMLGFLIYWEVLLEDGFDDRAQLLMLMVLAGALGIQGSAVQRFGVPGLSSTYLTGTLTILIAGVSARRPWPSLLPGAKLLVALIVGSGVGAAVAVHIPRLAPIVLVVPLAAVMIGGLALRERERP
jgi:uncharacterized membrane protein YoaK (UPF0700 family)